MGLEVCPVHRPEVKSIQILSIHVDAMLCDPQPRGLKRKYPSEDEDDEDDPPATKSYSQQRQEVFELSYEKLCRFRQSPDSSLLRYVLIFNTMRSVEQEMERDGIKINCLSGGPFLPPVNCDMSTLDPPPPSPYAMAEGVPPPGFPPNMYSSSLDATDCAKSVLPSAISSSMAATDAGLSVAAHHTTAGCGGCDYDRCLLDFYSKQSGRVTPFVRTAYERSEAAAGALWTDDSDRLTSINWSSVLNFGSSCSPSATSCPSSPSPTTTGQYGGQGACGSERSCSTDDDGYCSTETSLHTLMPPAAPSCMGGLAGAYSSSSSSSGSPNTSPSSGNISPASGSSPTSSEDEIFGDIDLTLYDFDLMSPLSPPNVRMAPVSAEELMRSLSNNPDSASEFYKNDHFADDCEQVTTSVRS